MENQTSLRSSVLPPPSEQATPWGWARRNLFSSLGNSLLTVLALALIFALVDTPDSGGVIHETELSRALDWGDYLRTHAERGYSAAVVPETGAAHALLTKIEGGKLVDSDGVLLESFTPRVVATKHWAGLDTPEAVRKAADLLVDYGWLRREVGQPGAAGGVRQNGMLHHILMNRLDQRVVGDGMHEDCPVIVTWRGGHIDLQCQAPVFLKHPMVNVLNGFEPGHLRVVNMVRFIVKDGQFFNLSHEFAEISLAVGGFADWFGAERCKEIIAQVIIFQ